MTISRSIYGIRIPGTIGDVIHQLDGLRPLMMHRAQLHIARAVARLACEAHDLDQLSEQPQDTDYIDEAYQRILERQHRMEAEQIRDPMIDTSFDVVLRGEGHVVIMMSFTEHMEWFEELLSLPGAEDFSFWTGSDRPESVSEEDWELRRKTYSRILARDPHGRAAGVGVTHAFQPPKDRPPLEMICAELPSKVERANLMACQIIFSKWIENRKGETSPGDRIEFMRDLKSPEMQGAVALVANNILPLMNDLTPDQLTGVAPRLDAREPDLPEL